MKECDNFKLIREPFANTIKVYKKNKKCRYEYLFIGTLELVRGRWTTHFHRDTFERLNTISDKSPSNLWYRLQAKMTTKEKS